MNCNLVLKPIVLMSIMRELRGKRTVVFILEALFYETNEIVMRQWLKLFFREVENCKHPFHSVEILRSVDKKHVIVLRRKWERS